MLWGGLLWVVCVEGREPFERSLMYSEESHGLGRHNFVLNEVKHLTGIFKIILGMSGCFYYVWVWYKAVGGLRCELGTPTASLIAWSWVQSSYLVLGAYGLV